MIFCPQPSVKLDSSTSMAKLVRLDFWSLSKFLKSVLYLSWFKYLCTYRWRWQEQQGHISALDVRMKPLQMPPAVSRQELPPSAPPPSAKHPVSEPSRRSTRDR